MARKNCELAELKVETIAGLFGVKKAFLSKEFKKKQQVALGDFIIRERLYRTFQMIEKNQDVTVKELARISGFKNIDSFTRRFEDLFLIDPDRFIDLKKRFRGNPNKSM